MIYRLHLLHCGKRRSHAPTNAAADSRTPKPGGAFAGREQPSAFIWATDLRTPPGFGARLSSSAFFLSLILRVVLVISTASCAIAAAPDSLFREGIDLYHAGNYPTAVETFAQAAHIRPASGTLQNLGLAEWQRGRLGESILAWEEALWFDPFNRAAHSNLQYVRRLAQVEAPDLTWYEAVSSALPMNWWTWAAALSFWVAVAAVMLPAIFRRPRSATSQAIAALCLMIFLLTIIAQVGVQTRSRIGFVLAKDSLLRLTPTAEAQPIARLQPGEPVRIKKTRGQYVLIRTNRALGWVLRREIGSLCGDGS
jgi:hypothetical protein